MHYSEHFLLSAAERTRSAQYIRSLFCNLFVAVHRIHCPHLPRFFGNQMSLHIYLLVVPPVIFILHTWNSCFQLSGNKWSICIISGFNSCVPAVLWAVPFTKLCSPEESGIIIKAEIPQANVCVCDTWLIFQWHPNAHPQCPVVPWWHLVLRIYYNICNIFSGFVEHRLRGAFPLCYQGKYAALSSMLGTGRAVLWRCFFLICLLFFARLPPKGAK